MLRLSCRLGVVDRRFDLVVVVVGRVVGCWQVVVC